MTVSVPVVAGSSTSAVGVEVVRASDVDSMLTTVGRGAAVGSSLSVVAVALGMSCTSFFSLVVPRNLIWSFWEVALLSF